MATKQQQLSRRAILLHAILRHAEKEIKDLDLRDQLEPGGSHQVQVTIAGLVGRANLDETFVGQLTVGHDGTSAKSEAPAPAHVLAAALRYMPQTKADEFRGQLSAGRVPDATEEEIAAATKLLQRARRQLPDVTRRGSVSLVPATSAQAAA